MNHSKKYFSSLYQLILTFFDLLKFNGLNYKTTQASTYKKRFKRSLNYGK